MKHWLSFIFAALILTACAQNDQQIAKQTSSSTPSAKNLPLGIRETIAIPDATFRNAPRYEITATLSPDLRILDASQQIFFRNNSNAPINQIPLRVYPNVGLEMPSVNIATIEINGQRVNMTATEQNSAFLVPLSEPLPPNDAVEIKTSYQITLPKDGGNYNTFGYSTDVIALAQFYPMIPAINSSGWNLEIPAPWGDVIAAEASFFDVSFTAPNELRVVATGVTSNETDNGDGTKTWHLQGGPLREFNLVASKNYERISQKVENIDVNSYFLPKNKKEGQAALEWASQALAIFNKTFGPYPYTELDVVATPTSAGGVEYSGMIAIADQLYDNDNAFFEFVIAHEVAHQWWYNVVGNDQQASPWLDEALAQYSSLIYYEQRYGVEEKQKVLESFNTRWERVKSQNDQAINLPVEKYSSQAYGAIVYGKGPLFIERLREKMGDGNFFSFLKSFYTRYSWQLATEKDLLTTASKTCDCDLNDLYPTWLTP